MFRRQAFKYLAAIIGMMACAAFLGGSSSSDDRSSVVALSAATTTTNLSYDCEGRVKLFICAQLGCDANKVVPTDSFIGDLGADDLDVVELVMALEEDFGMMVADANEVTTVQDAVDSVCD